MVRFKSWVANVIRLRGEAQSRHGLIRLDKNERVTPFPKEFLEKLMSDFTSDHLNAYPEPEKLYQKLAQHHNVSPNNFMLTAGSDAGIRHCFELFVNHGGEVVVLDPTFAMVDIYCQLSGARKQSVGYDKDLQLDMDRLLTVIGQKTDLVVIANPNSPTGTLISECDITAILQKAKSFNVPVLIDEAYYGFCKQTAVSMVKEFDNLIVSRTFSKAYGLAGLRVGYLLAQEEVAQLLYRFRPMYEVNSIGVHAAVRLLEQPEIIEKYLKEIEEGRRYLLEYAREEGLSFRDSQTNFVYIDFGDKKQRVVDVLSNAGILVRGGLPIEDFESYLRISLGPENAMQTLVAALRKANN